MFAQDIKIKTKRALMKKKLIKYCLLLSCFFVYIDTLSSGGGKRDGASTSESDSEDKEDKAAGKDGASRRLEGREEECSESDYDGADDDADEPPAKLNQASKAIVDLYNNQLPLIPADADSFDESVYATFLKELTSSDKKESDERDFASNIFEMFPKENLNFLFKDLMKAKKDKDSDQLLTNHSFYLGFSNWKKLADDSKATISRYFSLIGTLNNLHESQLEEEPSKDLNVLKSFTVGCLAAASLAKITEWLHVRKIVDQKLSLRIIFKNAYSIQKKFDRGCEDSSAFWDRTTKEAQRETKGKNKCLRNAIRPTVDTLTIEKNIITVNLDQLASHMGRFFWNFFTNEIDVGCDFWGGEAEAYQKKLLKQLKQKIEQKALEDELLEGFEASAPKPGKGACTQKKDASSKKDKKAQKAAERKKEALADAAARAKDATLEAALAERLRLATVMSASEITAEELKTTVPAKTKRDLEKERQAQETALKMAQDQERIRAAARKSQEALAKKQAGDEKAKLGPTPAWFKLALEAKKTDALASDKFPELSPSTTSTSTDADSEKTALLGESAPPTPHVSRPADTAPSTAKKAAKKKKRAAAERRRETSGLETRIASLTTSSIKFCEVMKSIDKDPRIDLSPAQIDGLSREQIATLIAFQWEKKQALSAAKAGSSREQKAPAPDISSVKFGEVMAAIIKDPRPPLSPHQQAGLSPEQIAALVGFQDVIFKEKFGTQTDSGLVENHGAGEGFSTERK